MPALAAGATVSDVMIWRPKTLPADATVGDVRRMLANEHVVMALLTEGARFCGAVTAIPDNTTYDAPARAFADPAPATIGPRESAAVAFERAAASDHGRLVVLDDDSTLLGLVSVSVDRHRFCTHAGTPP